MPPIVHLAIAQFRPRKGQYAANLGRLGELFGQMDGLDPRPAVLQLPETALTGYFLEGGVREAAKSAGALARDLDAAYRAAVHGAHTLDVVIGFYELWENKLYNSAMYVTVGGPGPLVRHVHRKVFLPTYGLFDEERFVERGLEIRAFDTGWGRAAILVCEDAWHSISGTIAALDGAQIIFVPTAPPARGIWKKPDDVPGPASASRWERLALDMAEEHGVYVTLAHLVGSEGGKIFPGGSMVAGPKGDVRGRGPLWEEAILALPMDLGDLTRARADMPLVADLETMLPHLRANLDAVMEGRPVTVTWGDGGEDCAARGDARAGTEGAGAGAPPREKSRTPDRPPPHRSTAPRGRNALSGDGGGAGALPVVRPPAADDAGPTPLDIDAALVEEWLVHFLREEFERRGFANAIVGVSGGVDSAVTAYLAAKAFGPEHVIGVRLPYRTSSAESLDHAQLVIDASGIRARTLDISAAVDGYLALEPDADAARRGNVMARMRMIALFDLSARERAIPLGTGNKTERLFGYFTWHADDSPPVNPLGDLFKTQVWELAKHLGVPEVIVSKAPTADLVVGQTDEGDFGISYARADRILNWMLSGYTDAEIARHGFPDSEIALVRRRLESTHWKRRLPTVAMVSHTAIGESYLRPVDH